MRCRWQRSDRCKGAEVYSCTGTGADADADAEKLQVQRWCGGFADAEVHGQEVLSMVVILGGGAGVEVQQR